MENRTSQRRKSGLDHGLNHTAAILSSEGMKKNFGKRRATRCRSWLAPKGPPFRRLGALVFRLGQIRKSHNGLAPMSSDQDPDSRSCVGPQRLAAFGRKNVFPEVLSKTPACSGSTVDFSHWFSTRQVCAQEGSLDQGLPTWRFRVLKAALRLRPRRALSSASGQKQHLSLERLQTEDKNSALKPWNFWIKLA